MMSTTTDSKGRPTMDYELIDLAHRRQVLTDQLRAAEQQHYTEVLRKIANPNDRTARDQASDNAVKLEAGIAALREELARLDDAPVEAAPAPAPVVEPPAPASTVSAVHGDLSASEPETDAPAS